MTKGKTVGVLIALSIVIGFAVAGGVYWSSWHTVTPWQASIANLINPSPTERPSKGPFGGSQQAGLSSSQEASSSLARSSSRVSAAASASIDEGSLKETSSTPMLTGTAANTDKVGIAVLSANGHLAYYSGKAAIAVIDDHWKVGIPSALVAGTYKVYVYTASGGPALTSGTMTVVGSSVPTATIDAKALTQTTSPFSLTGSVSGSNSLTIFIEPLGYTGPTDYHGIFRSVGSGAAVSTGDVSNGRWSALFGLSTHGNYVIFVYDTTSEVLLTTEPLTIL